MAAAGETGVEGGVEAGGADFGVAVEAGGGRGEAAAWEEVSL